VGRCSTAQGIVDAVIALAGKNASDDVTILVLRRNPIIS
jgi:serine phosphatase RsbU (regulator of sigma subunit)